MADSTNTKRFSFWLWLIRVIGIIVPRRLRADWRQEWEAELRYRETLLANWNRLDWRNKLDLLWHSLGAFADALWLQPRRWEDEMIQDLRFGLRMLLKSPVFTLAAILSLAIGIGANTALFSVINAVLWRQLPYPHAERLVRLGDGCSKADFVALSKANSPFEKLAAWAGHNFTITGRGEAMRLAGQRVSREFFSLLGVTSQAGRTFAAEEFQPGQDLVAIISDRLWRNRFGADPQIIGQTVTLDERSYTVIGVTPASFDFFPSSDLLTPLAFTAADLGPEADHLFIEDCCGVQAIARIKQGIALERARQELATIWRGFNKEQRDVHPPQLRELRESQVENFRMTLLTVWGVVGFVLLIACANLANLMLARAAGRQKELAVRAAIGARRLRLIRQLLTESVLVALLGGALGLLFAYFGVKALSMTNPVIHQMSLEPIRGFDPFSVFSSGGSGHQVFDLDSPGMARIPRLGEITIDGAVMVFSFVLALLTGTLFGLAPALQFSRPNLSHALKDGAAVSGAGFGLRRRRLTQNLLVISEVALALVLLVGAGLLIRSIWRLHAEELGFQMEKLLTIRLEFPSFKYGDREAVTPFVTLLSEKLAALPGVESVGAADSMPLLKKGSVSTITIDGNPESVWSPVEKPKVRRLRPNGFYSEVSPNYFRTMGIPLRQGREFDARDNQQSSPVVIINEEMARRHWPGENPIGKRIKHDFAKSWRTVIGVVGNVKRFALEDQALPEFYLPLQQPWVETRFYLLKTGTFVVVRFAERPEVMAEAVRQTVWSLDRDQPISRLATMEDRLADIFAPRRFNMLVFGLFAFIALVLAAVGIYGVIAHSVVQRTHEIGIRMALGAERRDVLWLVISQGMILTLTGLAVGLFVALGLTRVLKNLLFGVSATDPATFVGIALLLAVVAFIACYIPARKATKVDPLVALRHE